MRRLVSSDWQLQDGARDRYRTNFVVDQLPKLLDKYKIDQLLCLGDVAEQKDNHPATLVNEIVDAFYNLQKQCKVIILQGNHDFLHKGHPYFHFVSKFDNVEWISKPTELDNCLYLPHTRDYKKDWKDVKFVGYDFIFAHNIFTGVSTNTGHALSGIPTNIFPDDCQVIAGDVHDPQELADGKIVYVGSPTLCDFGDDYAPRVLLLDDLKIKSIKVSGPQKRLIDISWDSDHCLVAPGVNEGDIVKIRVQLRMKDVAVWAAIRQEVESWATKCKFVVNTIQPVVNQVVGERQKLVKSSKKEDAEYLVSFVKRLGVDKETAEVGANILQSR